MTKRRTWCTIGVVLGASVIGVTLAAPMTWADANAMTGTSRASGESMKRVYPTIEEARAVRARQAGRAQARSPQPQLAYRGGRDGIGVTLTPEVYVVFWGSQWGIETPPGSANFTGDPLGLASVLVAMLSGIGTDAEEWSGVMTQYCEGVVPGAEFCPGSVPHVGYPDGGALAGYWTDTAGSAPATASAAQIAAEAVRAAEHFGNTTAASNRNAQYVIVSPTGTHPDGFNAGGGFCAWHDFTTSTYGDLAFTNLPYVPDMGPSCGANFVNPGASGVLDGVTMVEGHEYAETITDQNPEGGWLDSRGFENADKCAWVSSGIGRAQNVTFATGTFAMQGTWSNAERSCQIAGPIWGRPDGPDDFAIEPAPRSGFAQPGERVETTIQTARISGNGQTITFAVTGAPAGVTTSLSTDAVTTDDSVVLTVTTSGAVAYGSYPITITAIGSVSHEATYTLVVGPPPTHLQPLVTTTGLSGAAGSDRYFYVDLPGSYVRIEFGIGGGTGNADLFASVGRLPTDDDYECASTKEDNRETCAWFHSGGARWYLRVHGTTDYTDVAIQASFATTFGQPGNRYPYPLSGTAGSVQFLLVKPPATGARRLMLTLKGMTRGADVDLFVGRTTLPTSFAYDCASARSGSRSEKCVLDPAFNGTYMVGVYGVTDFTNVKLRSRWR